MPALTDDEFYAAREKVTVELSGLTGMSASEWLDFYSLSADDQVFTANGYRSMSWAQHPDTLGKVLAVAGALATIAGAVSGVASAVSAVQALKTLL